MFILFVDGHLPVPTLEIQSGEPTGAVKGVNEVINAGQGVCILNCGRIKLSKINTSSA